MRYTFLEKRDNTVYFVGGKLEIFIPKFYFEKEIAEEAGTKILTMGIFVMKYFKNNEDKSSIRYQMSLPENIVFSYTDYEDVEGIVLEGLDADNYKKYTLYNGDIFIESVSMPISMKNTEKFLNIHHGAKIPRTIKYGDIMELYIENMSTNDCDLKVPAAILEMTIGELARESKDNLDIPFRKTISTKNVSEYNYYQISIQDLAMNNSTFTAITSENMNRAVISGVNKSRTNAEEIDIPMEKTIKY